MADGISSPATPLQAFHVLGATDQRADSMAVRFEGRSLTWSELERRSRSFANGLRAEGVQPGDAWAILSRNCLEWAEASIGNGRAGSWNVPLNWHLTVPELTELLVDSGAKLLMVAADLEGAGRSAATRAGIDRIIVFGNDYETWLESHSDAAPAEGPVGLPLQYTGGTTGRSKGVVRAQSPTNASNLMAPFSAWGQLIQAPRDGRALLHTPAYHALGGAFLRTALALGNSVEITDRWDPIEMLELIERERITSTVMVPTQFIRLLKLSDSVRSQYDVSSIEWVLHTAAPCPAWAKRGMIDWFGPVIVELYGASEGVGPVIATSDDWLSRPGTVGRATSALELSILDDDGNDLPPGEIGTIYAARPEGPPRYHDDPEKTARMVRPDGRFTVGDVGWLDEDGFLFLADRRVDLIISGGTNIYPAEIEAVLSQHPDVADVAVFGVPHPEWGQEVKAVVEPVAGVDLDVDDLLGFGRARLGKFKLPRSVDVVDALPREASGKLKKRVLREPYWANEADQTGN